MRKALMLALEVMRNNGDVGVDEWIATENAIKEALAQPEQSCPECVFGVCHCKPLAQPEQEPVAYLVMGPYEKTAFSDIGSANAYCKGLNKGFDTDAYIVSSLYTTPPQRTWVGLTDREKSNIWLESRAAIPRFHTYASLVEAKLKEKNT